jgi:hypothetical protein
MWKNSDLRIDSVPSWWLLMSGLHAQVMLRKIYITWVYTLSAKLFHCCHIYSSLCSSSERCCAPYIPLHGAKKNLHARENALEMKIIHRNLTLVIFVSVWTIVTWKNYCYDICTKQFTQSGNIWYLYPADLSAPFFFLPLPPTCEFLPTTVHIRF